VTGNVDPLRAIGERVPEPAALARCTSVDRRGADWEDLGAARELHFGVVMEEQADTLGRPPGGVGHYLRDIVYGALDGVVTTLAVLSGASGAKLEPRIGLILGLANLVGDGLSMGASNYLGLKSELQQSGIAAAIEMPWRHGTATAVAFALFGALPLVAYVVPSSVVVRFPIAIALALVALALLGKLRAGYVRRSVARSIAEVTVVGLAASAAAYAAGAVAALLTR